MCLPTFRWKLSLPSSGSRISRTRNQCTTGGQAEDGKIHKYHNEDLKSCQFDIDLLTNRLVEKAKILNEVGTSKVETDKLV
jgi:hypothetical protein